MDSQEQSVGKISNVQSWLESNHRFTLPIEMKSPPIRMSNEDEDDSNSIDNHLEEERNQRLRATDENVILPEDQLSSRQRNLSNESGGSNTIESLVDEAHMQNDSQTESNASALSERKTRSKDLNSLALIVARIHLECNIVKIKNVNPVDLVSMRNHLNLFAKMIKEFSRSGAITINADDNIVETNATVGGVEPCPKKLSAALEKLAVAVTGLIDTVDINSMSVQEKNGIKRALICQVLFLQLAIANIDKIINP
ncbi:hypothetical protein HA402_006116 [Bradysia odoriphaga]|nr:hypothetical protein HA402_006116 [Bradysia odoriphaga]